MAKDDGAKIVLGIGAIALFWNWWKVRNNPALLQTGGGSANYGGSQSAKPGCGSCSTKPFQPANPAAPKPIGGGPIKPSGTTYAGSRTALTPPAAPGGNIAAASGSASQWQGVTFKTPGVFSGPTAPQSPSTPQGSTVYQGNTRGRVVRG